MIQITPYSQLSPQEILNRDIRSEPGVEEAVDGILADVRARGDEALLDCALRFDRAALSSLEVTPAELEAAWEATDPYFRETLTQAAQNIREFHKRQLRQSFVVSERQGVVLGQRFTPLARVGVYVPGGRASYPSTVLMNAIPAALAGVGEIVMVTPPAADGSVPGPILAAARVAGVSRIFKIGGAQAVAALAYGTRTIPRVDKVVGPGNVYVAAAKRRVFGLVDIDMIAGPSEILVVADGGSNPAWVAADMLSQAEHDPLASAVLVTDSRQLAEAVAAELERQLPLLERSAIARESMEQNGKIILADSLAQAVEIANLIAPEHLELSVEDPFSLLGGVKHAGSVFLGRHAPEALGDYFAGPNHTLPTSGTARFSSPLSVDDFVKKSSFIYYTRQALGEVGERVADFAAREGLTAHARSLTIRFEEEAKP